jgi:hypothetical protein
VTREEAIEAICRHFHRGELAAGYIASGKTVDEVKAHLAMILATDDQAVDKHTFKGPPEGD